MILELNESKMTKVWRGTDPLQLMEDLVLCLSLLSTLIHVMGAESENISILLFSDSHISC